MPLLLTWRWEIKVVPTLCEKIFMHNQFHLGAWHLKLAAIANKIVDLSTSLLDRSRCVVSDRVVGIKFLHLLDDRSENSESWNLDRLALLGQDCLDVLYSPIPYFVEHFMSALLLN